ncbi:hypothetical protein CPB86DRAFT_814064 [Serendipita vermifera]|nr:hypothetical protein CPB86DRAFT_814064 [Serendipita vermifera]
MDHSSNMLQDRNDASNSPNATPLVDPYSTTSTRYPPLPLLSTRTDRDQRPESNTPPSPILYPMDIEDISFPEAQSPLQRRGQVDNPLRNATHSDPPTGIVTGDRNIPNSNTTITPLDLLKALPPVPTGEPGRNNDQTPTEHGQPGRVHPRRSVSHRAMIAAREPEDGVRVPSPSSSISIPVRPPPVYSSQTPISPASTAQGVSHFHAQQPPLPEEQHHVITTQPRLTEQPDMTTPHSTTEPTTQQPSYKRPMSMRSRKSYSQDTCDECSKTCNGTCKAVVACAPWLLGIVLLLLRFQTNLLL